jgi:hypothetical protein
MSFEEWLRTMEPSIPDSVEAPADEAPLEAPASVEQPIAAALDVRPRASPLVARMKAREARGGGSEGGAGAGMTVLAATFASGLLLGAAAMKAMKRTARMSAERAGSSPSAPSDRSDGSDPG